MEAATPEPSQPNVLGDHRKIGKTFVPPLAQLPLQLTSWEAERLPQYLWNASLLRMHGLGGAAIVFHQACDILEICFESTEENEVFIGYISDFGSVAGHADELERKFLLASIEGNAFPRLFRVALSPYDACPAAWLARDPIDDEERIEAIGFLQGVVERIRDGSSEAATHSVMLSMARIVKSGKMHFSRDVMTEEDPVLFPPNSNSTHTEPFSVPLVCANQECAP